MFYSVDRKIFKPEHSINIPLTQNNTKTIYSLGASLYYSQPSMVNTTSLSQCRQHVV